MGCGFVPARVAMLRFPDNYSVYILAKTCIDYTGAIIAACDRHSLVYLCINVSSVYKPNSTKQNHMIILKNMDVIVPLNVRENNICILCFILNTIYSSILQCLSQIHCILYHNIDFLIISVVKFKILCSFEGTPIL